MKTLSPPTSNLKVNSKSLASDPVTAIERSSNWIRFKAKGGKRLSSTLTTLALTAFAPFLISFTVFFPQN